jgi:hypothetical protein
VVYQEARRTFIDELGVEPGRELQRIHAAILRGSDPEPDGQSRATVVAGGGDNDGATQAPMVKPAQLPPGVSNFVGRTDELARLDAMLLSSHTEPKAAVIAALFGSAGVGKTALALHWAGAAAERFPDGQLFMDMRGHSLRTPIEPADALATMLRALGVKPEETPGDLDEAASLYRSLLARRRCWSCSTTPSRPSRSSRCCREAAVAWSSSPAAIISAI